MTDTRIRFANPARLGQDAALALEDYARVASSRDAVVLMDAGHHVTGISLASSPQPLGDSVMRDIEHFFESLAREAARTGHR